VINILTQNTALHIIHYSKRESISKTLSGKVGIKLFTTPHLEETMRKIIFILFIFTFPGTLWAADPIIGTWKTNLEKSTFPADQQGIKEDINTYREIEGDLIELSIKTINPDGSLYTALWTWPKQGGFAKVLSRTLDEGVIYVQTLIEPGHWCVNIMKDGKQIARYHKIVSKDGKTMRQTLIGDKDGNPISIMKVLERQ
jgi:hypothetical protein